MLQTVLFLGIPLDDTLDGALARVNPPELALFTQGGDEYLEFCEISGQRLLGKPLGDHIDMRNLELTVVNVLSLLKRLVPALFLEASALVLVSRVQSD